MQSTPIETTPRPLQGSSHRFPYVVWLLALIFCAFAASLLYADMRPARGVAPWVAWGAVGVLCLPGLFFLWYSVMETLRFFRYRGIELLLHPLPARAGGTVSGALEVPVSFDAENIFRVELTAIEYRRVNHRKVLQHVMVQEIVEARAAPGLRGTRLSFSLRIPADAPPSQGYGETMRWTSATHDKVYLRWTLAVSADVPGVDLKVEYELPLRQATDAEAALATEAPSKGLSSAPAPRKLCYESAEQGGRLVIRQAPWKKGIPPSHVFVLMAFFGVFFLVGVGVIVGPIIYGGLDLAGVLLVGLVGSVFILVSVIRGGGELVAAANDLRAEISRDGVEIRRTLWGVRLTQVRLDPARIAAVEVRVETVPYGGPPSRSVIVREHDGAAHCIAECFPNAGEAEALRSRIAARLAQPENAEAGKAARAAAAAEAQRAERRGGKYMYVAAAVMAGAMILFLAYNLHPAWFSFSAPAPVPVQSAPPTPAKPAVRSPADRIDDAMMLSSRAAHRDVNAAIGLLDGAVRMVREQNGPDHPLEAYLLNSRARVERQAQNDGAAERSLVEAVRIMESHSPADARRLLGNRGGELDRERLAFSAGEFFWDRRRYADAHVYFVKAWEAALVLGLDENQRNSRRAHSSARVMATACAQGKWELADQAMAELKERYARVDASAREGLKYWIDTGEPRLKARKC